MEWFRSFAADAAGGGIVHLVGAGHTIASSIERRTRCISQLAKLPKPIVARLHNELVKFIQQPDTRKRVVADGSEPVGSSPEEFRKFLHAEIAKWAKLVKESGIKVTSNDARPLVRIRMSALSLKSS